MPSMSDSFFALTFTARPPLSVLPQRRLRLTCPLPHQPLLRALEPNESPPDTLWSDWLAEWGWTWTTAVKTIHPREPLIRRWLLDQVVVTSLNIPALALAFALRLKINGTPLEINNKSINIDLEQVCHALNTFSQKDLEQALALALLQHDDYQPVFDLTSSAPDWSSDIRRVFNERRALRDRRQPDPLWLNMGYRLMDQAFADLRGLATSVDECNEIWDEFADDRALPEAFRMVFWWEAVYCLTEHHAYADAEQAQQILTDIVDALGQLTGQIMPLWHHQKGRLLYYAGNFEYALTEFVSEYATYGRDPRSGAMLNRDIANVLSDLACLEAAQHFAEQSVTLARQQGQDSERYKSLGRLGELYIKRNQLADAQRCFEESLSIQTQHVEDNRSPAQTLTYLGHVALLSGHLAEAERYYEQADQEDQRHLSQSSQPYILMGRFARLRATEDWLALADLWHQHYTWIEEQLSHPTHVLPAAVCVLAAKRNGTPPDIPIATTVQALINKNYIIEAAYLAFALPADQREALLSDCVQHLKRWEKTLKSLSNRLKSVTGELTGPTVCIEAINRCHLAQDPIYRSLCYPMTLVRSDL